MEWHILYIVKMAMFYNLHLVILSNKNRVTITDEIRGTVIKVMLSGHVMTDHNLLLEK